MKKTLTIILVLLSVVGMAPDTNATQPTINWPVDISLRPITPVTLDGPVTIELKLVKQLAHWYEICGDMTVEFEVEGKLQSSGPSSWAVSFQETDTAVQTFDVTFLPDDTCSISAILYCQKGGRYTGRSKYFVTTADSVEQWGERVPIPPEPVQPDRDAMPSRDTMTVEQLATKLKIAIDLSDPDHLRFAERLLGPIPDSAIEPRGRKGIYHLNVSLDNILKIRVHGIEIEEIKPRKSHKERLKDARKIKSGQSSLNSSASSIYLSSVDGLTNTGMIWWTTNALVCP